jgi:hypothetical protein
MAYGYMTKSWLASPENHATQRERKAATAKYEREKKLDPAAFPMVEIVPACRCPKWPFPHIHGK